MSEQGVQGSVLPAFSNVRVGFLEDDAVIAAAVEVVLDRNAWKFCHYTTVADFNRALEQESFDLLLLDWSLPDGEADKVIRKARAELQLATPIMIESVNGDEQHIVDSLLLGADDYVVKPLRLSELEARMKALLRRRQLDTPNVNESGLFYDDAANRQLFLRGEALELTDTEYRLACHFLDKPNELLSREQLLADVWNSNPEIDTRTVDMHVSRLRRKLRLGEATGLCINSLRGYGYRLESCDNAD